MFTSKQFRNFVHSKSVDSVFSDCVFEITRANSVQVSFSILEISSKKCVAHLKINFALLAHKRERFFAKVSANCLLRHNCFC